MYRLTSGLKTTHVVTVTTVGILSFLLFAPQALALPPPMFGQLQGRDISIAGGGSVCKDGEIGIGKQNQAGVGMVGVIVANDCNPICSKKPKDGPLTPDSLSPYCGTDTEYDQGCSVTCPNNRTETGGFTLPTSVITTDKRQWGNCYEAEMSQVCRYTGAVATIQYCCSIPNGGSLPTNSSTPGGTGGDGDDPNDGTTNTTSTADGDSDSDSGTATSTATDSADDSLPTDSSTDSSTDTNDPSIDSDSSTTGSDESTDSATTGSDATGSDDSVDSNPSR
ncbi:hypothetical protein D9758_001454 [Tetrapyrgos nigripes]|uniref:Uncharacterized protein n=1 Tax=Tetrapyrgos nigripes TaxID=182062 RepID=A0A8H5GXU6_9AGAR|nr:hypothetical protein D9758_001454 [Tetrapyrgos nigripes]